MSKELIEQLLKLDAEGYQPTTGAIGKRAADRITELERELDTTMRLLDYASDKGVELGQQRDALQVDNERLRCALWDQLNDCINFDGGKLTDVIMETSTKVLNSTPAQSLTRFRNQTLDACLARIGKVIVTTHSVRTHKRALDAIRAMKEPEQ